MSGHGPQLRLANIRDAAGLASCYAESWRGAYQGIFPKEYIDRMIARRNAFWWKRTMDRIPDARPIVADFNGIIAGYVHFGKGRYGDMPDYGGEIYELYVRPEFQGLGYGTELFTKASATLSKAGVKGLMAWSLEENENCCRFYEARGGVEIGRSEVRFQHKWMPRIAYGWPAGSTPTKVSGDHPEL